MPRASGRAGPRPNWPRPCVANETNAAPASSEPTIKHLARDIVFSHRTAEWANARSDEPNTTEVVMEPQALVTRISARQASLRFAEKATSNAVPLAGRMYREV